jgi:hypothetical protein
LPSAAGRVTSPMAADWSSARRAWEKWTGKHVGSSGLPSSAPSLIHSSLLLLVSRGN